MKDFDRFCETLPLEYRGWIVRVAYDLVAESHVLMIGRWFGNPLLKGAEFWQVTALLSEDMTSDQLNSILDKCKKAVDKFMKGREVNVSSN